MTSKIPVAKNAQALANRLTIESDGRCARVVVFGLALALAGPLLGGPAVSPRPNVVLIMPDDVSYPNFSAYRTDEPRTPHIDRLARQSVRLTDFHMSPTCSPTRAALLTGRYNNATGVWHTINGRNHLRSDEVTMAEVFRANDYRTALCGKWHLGPNYPYRPDDRGFDHVATHGDGGIGQQHDPWGNSYLPPARFRVNDTFVPLTDEDDGVPGAFASNFFTSRAIEWMRERADRRERFFLYLPYYAAHRPHQMPLDAREGIDALTATIENMDKNVGRVLAFLDESGLANDTLLIFLTDNGHDGCFRGGKGSEFEGGVAVAGRTRSPDIQQLDGAIQNAIRRYPICEFATSRKCDPKP
ncbi:MAG: sulfatase-like hydrolase/transferase [Opitutaceae bacterium]